jgi:hypothetical protein
MDPRDHSFVKTGPDCVCGHPRLAHVGMHPRYRTLMWDLGCQVAGCMGCEPLGYRPLGPLSYRVLKLSDEALLAADLEAERTVRRRLRGWGFAAIGVVMATTVVGSAARQLDQVAMLVVLAVVAVAAIVAFVAVSVATVRHLDPPRGLTMTASLMAVPLMLTTTLQWLVPLQLRVVVAVGGACVGVGLVVLWLDGRRSQTEFERVAGAMRKDLDALTTRVTITVERGPNLEEGAS